MSRAELVSILEAELQAERSVTRAERLLADVEQAIATAEASGDECLREWTDAALALYLSERSDFLRGERGRRTQVTEQVA